MDVNVVSINQVFLPNRRLKIPFFQRGYVWEEVNWKQFFEDIATIVSFDGDDYPEKYFLGSIILKECGNRTFDVIDGQQRLTTIVMFMKALYLCLNRNDLFLSSFMQMSLTDERKPILMPNYNDQAMYLQVINQEVPKRDPIIEGNRLAECYAYFVRRILDARNPTDGSTPITPEDLLNCVTDNVRLVTIEVQRGENAQKIFETINCSGIKLTTGEMLKNFLFEESQRDEYERTWKQVFERDNEQRKYWEGDALNGRVSDSHIENFFYRYMLIKMQEPTIKSGLSTNEQKYFRQKTGLFEKYRRLITKFGIAKQDAIDEVVTYARMYMNTFPSNLLDEPAVQYPGIERLSYLMLSMDSWTMTPYILYILKNVSDHAEQTAIFRYIETYLIRRIICKSKNNNYSDMFSENLIGQGVKTFEKFKEYVNDADARGALLMPNDQDVLDALKVNDLKRDAATILYMLESRINANLVDSEHSSTVTDFYSEAIMPEKATTNWPLAAGMSEDDRKKIAKTLGNFVILREKLKTKDKNAKWTDKREVMKPKSDDLETSVILRTNLDKWDAKTIENRAKWLASKIIDAWPI